jgi:hypothetical protein
MDMGKGYMGNGQHGLGTGARPSTGPVLTRVHARRRRSREPATPREAVTPPPCRPNFLYFSP